MAEYTSFEDWQREVDRRTAEVWAANGGGLAFDPINPEIGVGAVLNDGGDEEAWELREARMRCFQGLMDFIWADGPNPIAALKRLFVITRCGSPGHLAFMTQTDVAALLNETRAATQAREERVWETWLEKQGFFGTRTRLKKSNEAREKYAAAAKGNVSRKGGQARVRKISVLRKQYAAENGASRPKPKTKRTKR